MNDVESDEDDVKVELVRVVESIWLSVGALDVEARVVVVEVLLSDDEYVDNEAFVDDADNKIVFSRVRAWLASVLKII